MASGSGEMSRRPQRAAGVGRGGGASGRRAGRESGRGSGPGGDRGAVRGRREPAARTAEQAAYDGPELDPEITGRELDRSVQQALRGLPDKLALRVARHLVAAGRLVDEDPVAAYRHTLAARARAARVAVVREACGEAAYAAGQFAEALAELRAAKRMNGAVDYLPMMADCERALGRPDRALALAKTQAATTLPLELRVEMSIVEAGARRDRGQIEAALRTLEAAPLQSRSRADWVVRLRYAYADTLLAAGRAAEAVEWFHRTVAVDAEQVTDAEERLATLETGRR